MDAPSRFMTTNNPFRFLSIPNIVSLRSNKTRDNFFHRMTHGLKGDRLVKLFRISFLFQKNSCIFMEGSSLKGPLDKYGPSSRCNKNKNEIIADFNTRRHLLADCNRKRREFPPFLHIPKKHTFFLFFNVVVSPCICNVEVSSCLMFSVLKFS